MILSLLFVQTLSLTHAVTHPFHADHAQAETHTYFSTTSELAEAEYLHQHSVFDTWVCELFDSVPNSALETPANLDCLVAEAAPPGLVVALVSLFSSPLYPSSWSRAPPLLN